MISLNKVIYSTDMQLKYLYTALFCIFRKNKIALIFFLLYHPNWGSGVQVMVKLTCITNFFVFFQICASMKEKKSI